MMFFLHFQLFCTLTYFTLSDCMIDSETSKNIFSGTSVNIRETGNSCSTGENGSFILSRQLFPAAIKTPPKFFMDLYEDNIYRKGRSKLEGAARIVSAVLQNGRKIKEKVVLAFKKPRVHRVRSVRLILAKRSGEFIGICNHLRISTVTNNQSVYSNASVCLRSKLISSNYSMFDITKLSRNWSTDDVPLNLTIIIHGGCRKRDPPWIPDVAYQLQPEQEDSPVLLFYDDEKQPFWKNATSLLRSMSDQRERTTRSPRGRPDTRRPIPCTLRPWEMHVDDIGWGDFVYLPTSFQVNFCRGKCRLLMNNDINSSIHSIVKSMYISRNMRNARANRRPLNPPRVTWSACVPDKFRKVLVLSENEGKFEFVEWDDIEATSCSCA